MSKVTKLIKARKTGKGAAISSNTHYFTYDESVYDCRHLNATILEVSATIGGEVSIKAGASGDAIERAIRNVNRQVVEEIHGEFREPLYALRRRAMERLDEESIKIIDKMIDDMFTV